MCEQIKDTSCHLKWNKQFSVIIIIPFNINSMSLFCVSCIIRRCLFQQSSAAVRWPCSDPASPHQKAVNLSSQSLRRWWRSQVSIFEVKCCTPKSCRLLSIIYSICSESVRVAMGGCRRAAGMWKAAVSFSFLAAPITQSGCCYKRAHTRTRAAHPLVM